MVHSPWVCHYDSTGLSRNFLGSPLSLAALMSSLRSDVKVSSISWKSEWTLGQPTVVEAGPQSFTCALPPPVPDEARAQLGGGEVGGGGEEDASYLSFGVLSVAVGSCRAWSFCQTVSCISSSKASSQCPRSKPVSRAGAH